MERLPYIDKKRGRLPGSWPWPRRPRSAEATSQLLENSGALQKSPLI